MSILKLCFVIAALVLVLEPAYASEENALRIENMTSISAIVNPVTSNLAKSVNAAPEWKNFIPPQAFWSPDGSKLLIRSSIRWYPDDVNFRPGNRNGIDAIYVMDSDGTNLTKIVSNEINNRSTPIELPAPIGNNPWSPAGDKIVIDVSVPRTGGFYLLANPDGGRLNALGTNFSDIISIITNLSKFSRQKDFAWSPDGEKTVLVVTDIINKSEKMYITTVDGSDIKQIANDANESFLDAVAWSHDGKQITFSGKSLWIMNNNRSNLKRLGDCWGGAWSPDDSRLLCTASEEEMKEQFFTHIYLINVDSGDKTEIIKSIEVGDPVWSPDGNSILFKSITERRNHGIYVADSLGRDVKLVYEEGSSMENATIEAVGWNPDGNKIAFTTSENGVKLFTINADGTGKTLLTSNLSWSWDNPYAWSPSGDKIAFSSSTSNGEHIFIANPDGTERTQITAGENMHYILSGIGGSWSPDGNKLLIESRGNEVFIAKLSGYGKTMPVQKRENTTLWEAVTPHQTADETPSPAMATDVPKTPGFSIIFAGITLIVLLFLIKRRNA